MRIIEFVLCHFRLRKMTRKKNKEGHFLRYVKYIPVNNNFHQQDNPIRASPNKGKIVLIQISHLQSYPFAVTSRKRNLNRSSARGHNQHQYHTHNIWCGHELVSSKLLVNLLIPQTHLSNYFFSSTSMILSGGNLESFVVIKWYMIYVEN